MRHVPMHCTNLAQDEPEDFVVTGTCYESLLGMAESLWKPKMVRGSAHAVSIKIVRHVWSGPKLKAAVL